MSTDPTDGRRTTAVQLELVLAQVPGVRVEPPDWERTGEVDVVFRDGVLLVRDADATRVQQLVGGVFLDEGGRQTPGDAATGRSSERLPRVRGVRVLAVETDVIAALETVDAAFGPGVATPDHLLWVTPSRFCPAVEPAVPPDGVVVPGLLGGPLPGAGSEPSGEPSGTPPPLPPPGTGVRVSVVDTGWWPAAADRHAWLKGVTGDEEPVLDAAGLIGPYAGHGTFTAGVVRAVAPGCTLRVEGVLSVAGASFESDVARELGEALAWIPDVISLQAGTTTRRDLPLLAFEVFAETLAQHKGTVLVAAAGNDASHRPFWPAASPWAVAVGALTADGSAAASYTNTGPWVDVFAVGDDHVNAYVSGTFVTREVESPPGQTREFDGSAVWSGTSFATPLVAGLLAARMTRTGTKAPRALRELLDRASVDAVPGVGPAVLS